MPRKEKVPMAKSAKAAPRWSRLLFDLLLGAFLFGLFLIVWLPPGGASSAAATGGAPATVMPMQGTSIIANISGSISTTDPTFIGPRHFRSGIRGDRNCQTTGVVGARYYDLHYFTNTSATSQQVSINFTSNCGFNTYEAVYSPQFDPTNICANYLSGPGVSGSRSWEFTVCANSTFSILVYGLEPGVTCSSYQLAVGGTSAIVFNGSSVSSPGKAFEAAPGGSVKGGAAGPGTRADVTRKRLKRPNDAFDARKAFVPLPEFAPPPGLLLPEAGPPLVVSVNGSLTPGDQTFTGPIHFRSGIPGDAYCTPFGFARTHVYDQYFFMNDSPTAQRISVVFTSNCGFNTYEAVYSPQFDPTNIC